MIGHVDAKGEDKPSAFGAVGDGLSRRWRTSDHASGSQAQDRADAEDVAEAEGAEHGTVTQAAKQIRAGQLQTYVRLLDGGLADGDGDDIANDHHQAHLRGPRDCGWSQGQEGSDHGFYADAPSSGGWSARS